MACTSPSPAPSPSTAFHTASPATATSPTASPSASIPPATGAAPDLGADTLLFEDDFDDAASGWGTGSTPGGEVAYVDGSLRFDTVASGNWVWSRRLLGTSETTLRLEATFTSSDAGYQGLLCGRTDQELFGGVIKTDGRWVFTRLTDQGSTILDTNVDPAWAITPAVPTRIALDCAGTSTGAFRMQLSLPDRGLGVLFERGSDGPAAFDRIGIYAEASSEAFTVAVDDLHVLGSGE